MSRYEGVSRIAKVIRGIGWIIVVLGVVGMVNGKDGTGVVFAVLTAFFGGVAFAIAWIVDGFAK
jgi:hypothetical protein